MQSSFASSPNGDPLAPGDTLVGVKSTAPPIRPGRGSARGRELAGARARDTVDCTKIERNNFIANVR